MIKITGCCLVIAATSLWGANRAKLLHEEISEIKYIQKMICLLQSEMSYSKVFLADIFGQMSEKLKKPYSTWLSDLHVQLNTYPNENFTKIWEGSIDKHLRAICYLKNEREGLKELGKQLGAVDLQVQIRFLELYIRQLETVINEKQEELKMKTKLYLCLGVMSGMFVSVLML